MARTNSIQQNKIDPTRPFFAAVGGLDIAVGYARTAQERLAKVDFEPKAIADGLQKEALALPGRVEHLVSEYVAELSDVVTETVDDLSQQYVGLAARGRTLVNRVRRQEATQAATAEARKTTTRAKTTATQTKKAASATRSSAKATATRAKNTASTAKSSAKATGTSAKKTASATRKATKAAAAKTGA
jgi:heparin binding hemagglutinin HbhA